MKKVEPTEIELYVNSLPGKLVRISPSSPVEMVDSAHIAIRPLRIAVIVAGQEMDPRDLIWLTASETENQNKKAI